MATEVEDLIKEQAATNLNLEILSENKDVFDSLLLEAEMTNNLLRSNSNSIVDLESKISDSFKALSSFINKSKVENNQLLIEDNRQEQTDKNNLPVIVKNILPEKSDFVSQNAFENTIEVVKDKEGNDITQFVEPLRLSEETLSDIDNNGEQALLRLVNIDRGINELVNNDSVSDVQQGVVVDRQNEDKAASGSVFDGLGGKASALLGKAGIIGAVALGTGALVKGIFDVLSDDKVLEDVTGKAVGELSATEKGFAAIANGVENLTFGLFTAREIFETIQPVADKLEEGIDALFDPDTGVFADFTNGLIKLFDGDIKGALIDTIKGVATLPLKVLELGQRIGSELLSLLPTDFTDALNDFIEPITDVIFDFILETVPNAFNSVTDTISGAFDSIVSVPEKIANFFTGFASDISNFIGNKLKSASELLPDFLGGDSLRSVADFFLDDKKAEQEVRQPVSKKEGLFKAISKPEAGFNIPVAKPLRLSADETTALSKQRLDEKQVNVNVEAPAPIVIQPQPKEKKLIIRRTEPSDIRLAMAGTGNI